MAAWSQVTSLLSALTGLVLASWPRTTGKNSEPIPRPRFWPAAGLRRSKIFWAGMILLGYISVQALNPAWQFFTDGETWWLEPIDFVRWLPSSVSAPFARANPWRTLVVFGSLLLLVSSVWTGFTRRKSYHLLFTLLAANAGLLALFGLAQRLSGATEIFWAYPSSNDHFVASFIYPNHAGPYLYLMVALLIGLAGWHTQRPHQPQKNAGAAAAFVVIAVCCALLVIFSYSRMSILLLLAYGALVGGHWILRWLQGTGSIRYRPETLPLALIFTAVIGVCVVTMQTEKIRERFTDLFDHTATAVLDRTLPRQAATAMFRDHWLVGWGAGCFRYGFSKYTKAYPAIHYFPHGPRRYWEHAHNDLLEFPVELGVVGLLPLAVILGCAIGELYRRRFWRNTLSLSLVLGCALLVVHAWVDFVFQNPAILLTSGVLFAGALRWTELDQPGGRRKAVPQV